MFLRATLGECSALKGLFFLLLSSYPTNHQRNPGIAPIATPH